MSKSNYIKTILTISLCAILFTGSSVYTDKAVAKPAVAVTSATSAVNEQTPVNPLDVVNTPGTYLNKKIVMNAKFDKFSTLGLDYKPAFKSSENYISFLIKRPDTSYDIPLSEMKLFLKRELAEKSIDLKSNDEVKIVGTVFSDALGDAWIDVEELTVTKKAPEQNGVK